MAKYTIITKNNEEVGQELREYIDQVYGGSIVSYCNAHKINYSGFMKAVNGMREFSDSMVSPLSWDKRQESIFEKRLKVED